MTAPPTNPLARYHRQMLLPEIGEDGQRRLSASHALVVGCGALGSVVADGLTRAGVGRITIVDRDLVELTNLQRQILFDEDDLAQGLPKAEAAARKLRRINSQVEVNAIVDDFNHTNALSLADGADVIVDGLDNFETRFLLNDLSVRLGRPYVYGGAVATHGMTATFLPHATPGMADRPWPENRATPCFRCVFDSPPPPGSTPTCDTAGVLGAAVSAIANLEIAEAIKALLGRYDEINRRLVTVDVWGTAFRSLDIAGAWEAARCPACRDGQLEFLEGKHAGSTTALCGRDAVQVVPARPVEVRLETVAGALRSHGKVAVNGYLLRAAFEDAGRPIELTLFPNGRALIKGVTDPAAARGVYSRYVGL